MRSPFCCPAWFLVGASFTVLFTAPGCIDALSVPNPANCVTSGIPCGEGMSCNLTTQLCESAAEPPALLSDCTANAGLCSTAQFCDSGLKQCLPRRFILGQPDERSNLNTSYGLFKPVAAKLITDTTDPRGSRTGLAVADSGNSRTLLWNEVPSRNRPADVVLGQPELGTINWEHPREPSAGSMYVPYSLASDGQRFLVSDARYHRVLIWNPIPTKISGDALLPASGLWGQHDFTKGGANASQTPSALGVAQPLIFAETGPNHGFYISDYFNHRVLGFTAIPADDNTAPQWVIGQPDFATTDQRGGPADLGGPTGLFSDGMQLFVTDADRSRILVYNLPLTRNQPTPDLVIGQSDLSGSMYNRGGAPGPDTLAAPTDVEVTISGGKRLLFVADSLNHRVLRYTLPSLTADLVLGQDSFASISYNRGGTASAASLWSPQTVSCDGTRLAVADHSNNRVLIWNSLPLRNGQASDVAIGQPDAVTGATNMPPAIHGLQFQSPGAVGYDGQRLLIADTNNHRVLIWKQVPKDGTTPPDIVLGQPDFSQSQANNRGLTGRSLSSPREVSSDGTRLAIADSDNHRVLIWNQMPTQSFVPADVVLGQPAMTTRGSGHSATELYYPECVHFAHGSLFVCDSYNNRVLRFDPPYANQEAAHLVLGQADFTTDVCYGAVTSAQRFCEPRSIASDSGHLFLVDRSNGRVLIWNQGPDRDFQPADVVIGALDFEHPDPADPLRAAGGMTVHGGRVFVTSLWHNHILYWNQIPTRNGTPPDGVLGQPDLQSSEPNSHALPPAERLSGPAGVAVAGDRLFIADQFNNRVVSRELPQ